jgi:hypothetical protein
MECPGLDQGIGGQTQSRARSVASATVGYYYRLGGRTAARPRLSRTLYVAHLCRPTHVPRHAQTRTRRWRNGHGIQWGSGWWSSQSGLCTWTGHLGSRSCVVVWNDTVLGTWAAMDHYRGLCASESNLCSRELLSTAVQGQVERKRSNANEPPYRDDLFSCRQPSIDSFGINRALVKAVIA